MKYFKTILAAIALSTTMVSCTMGDFGDINDNPNYPTEGSTSSLFTHAARFVRYFVFNSYYYDIWTQEYPGYLSESKNNQYGPLDCTTDFDTQNYYLYAIKNLNEIIARNNDATESEKSVTSTFGSKANQIAVAQTLRAFFYMSMADVLGPIPYSEALQGDNGNWLPKYDSVEDIYTALDKELCEAYNNMDDTQSLGDGDILYGGDISKWKKFNATLRMMMAIKLKDVAPEVGKNRFIVAYKNGGMQSADDSFKYQYDSYGGSSGTTYTNYSPMYCCANNVGEGNQNHVPNKCIVDSLKEYKDPRLFTYCNIGTDAYKGCRLAVDPETNMYITTSKYNFDLYKGVPFGLTSNSEVSAQSAGCASVGAKYCAQMATYGVITAARCLLVEAEAAELEWISKSEAENLYNEGVRASFEFEASTDASWTYDVEAYLAQDKVKLSADKDTAIKQILMQRWFAGYLCDGVEAWADWRINNIPEIPVYQGQLDNEYTTFPYRMQYYSEDKQSNEEACSLAIDTWFNGNDDRWERIWWDVKDNYSPVGNLN